MKQKKGIFINSDLRPEYYDQFHCLMQDCQLNCCKDPWRIAFDKKDYLKLKNIKASPKLTAQLTHTLKRIHGKNASDSLFGEFNTGCGACSLLNEHNMCSLQLEKGADILPKVCRVFPRFEKCNAFGYFERSLSPGCEGVLELLWQLSGGISFISDPLPESEQQIFILQDEGLFQPLQQHEIRSTCIDILQDRRFKLPQRILLMGILFQEIIDGETDVARWQAKAHELLHGSSTPTLLKTLSGKEKMRVQALFNNVHGLLTWGNQTPEYKKLQYEIVSALKLPVVAGQKISLASTPEPAFSIWNAAKARFEKLFPEQEYFMENLMVCLFFHLQCPTLSNTKKLWNSYIGFCNLYSFYHFMAVMSCREGTPGTKEELFRTLVLTSRTLVHSNEQLKKINNDLFRNESSTLAHMAVLLSD